MSIAKDIIQGMVPNFDKYIAEDELLDDIDEYGFTPLIECAITNQPHIAELLLKRGVDVNKPDITGHTALHWAIDNANEELVLLLLEKGANPNCYTPNGISPLVFPVLRAQHHLKQILYRYGARLDFAQDFIYAKLLGHRFELKGYIDIVNAENEFIELNYEGFMLEFTVAAMQDSLHRFTSSYSTRALRSSFSDIYAVIDGLKIASDLLRLQHQHFLNDTHLASIEKMLQEPLLIFPVASRGHAMGFVRYQHWWAKIDRGENSQKEGSVNIYEMTRPEMITVSFVQKFLFKKQGRVFFHQTINQLLGLVPIAKIKIPAQIIGNCSWANIQAILPVACALLQMGVFGQFSEEAVLHLNDAWVEWDRDRALDGCIQKFYQASPIRKASLASMLAAVLVQTCDAREGLHLSRAEKILAVLMTPEYQYILNSYLEEFCIKRLTRRGNNLLKLLDDCGINPNIGVNPIATGL